MLEKKVKDYEDLLPIYKKSDATNIVIAFL